MKIHPLHPAQLDVYLDQLIHPGSPHYNTGGYIRLLGRPDRAKLIEALASAPQVFDAFRMRFDHGTGETGFYVDGDPPFLLEELDFSSEADPHRAAAEWMKQDFDRPFDVINDKLLYRQALITISEDEHLSYNKYHHLITDGYGFAIWAGYIANKYRALTGGDDVSFSFPSYIAEANREARNDEAYLRDLAYWNDRLGDRNPRLLQPIATDREGSGSHTVHLTPDERAGLLGLQAQCGCSLQQLTLAALAIYFSRTTGLPDPVLGIPVHKRVSAALRRTMGMFSGILPCKMTYEGDRDLLGFLQEVRRNQLADYRHTHFLVSDFFRPGSHQAYGEKPFEVIVNYERLDFRLDFGDALEATTHHLLSAWETTPLNICWREFGPQQPLELRIDYGHNYFTQEDIESLTARLLLMLRSFGDALQQPLNAIGILAEEERQLLAGLNDTAKPYDERRTLPQLFDAQADRTPHATAIIAGDEIITYSELQARSNRLAHHLRSAGVKDGDIVPVFLRAGADTIVAILAVIRAGAAYLPVDGRYPPDRVKHMLDDSAARLVLADNRTASLVPPGGIRICNLDEESWQQHPSTPPDVTLTPDHLLYVIYTSGSTGRPKGAAVYHRSAINLFDWYASVFGIDAADRNIIISSLGFDLTQKNLYTTICTGGALILPEIDHYDVPALAALIARHKATIINCTPSAFYPFAEDEAYYGMIASLRLVILGGEPIKMPLLKNWIASGARAEVVNSYGPTECTDISSFYRVKEPLRFMEQPVPLGRPNTNVQLYVVNAQGGLQPLGLPGEICVGGEGVGAGYLHDPALTAAKFKPNPFGPGLLYHTGDLGRWLPDGTLLYLGRMDEQVKIRGFRIELSEIEHALQEQEGIEQAVVVVREGAGDLVAYAVGSFRREAVLEALSATLPSYMIPSFLVPLDEIPLTSNGKINRKALAGRPVTIEAEEQGAEPGTDTEKRLALLWQELLSIPRIGVNASFFQLGGNSLLATRLVSQVRRQLGVTLNIRDIFEHHTIARLSRHVDAVVANRLPELKKAERPDRIPLSFGQERLWYIDQLEGSLHYHLPLALRLHGRINTGALNAALQYIINRHEALRTAIITHEGVPFQQVLDAGRWELSLVDRRGHAEDADTQMAPFLKTPFDLSAGETLKATLVSYSDDEHLLLLKLHHIAADGWSVPIFLRELSEAYTAFIRDTQPALPELSIQYADYALWQRGLATGGHFAKDIGYWTKRLAGLAPLDLPTDHVRPPVQSSRGATHSFLIDATLKEDLSALARGEDASLFMVLLAAFEVLIHKYSGQEDICIGIPAFNRAMAETADLIGFFVNVLPIRTALHSGDSFSAAVRQTRGAVLDASAHQDAPFEQIVEATVRRRDVGRHPLFQVMFVYQENNDTLSLTGLRVTPQPLPHTTAKFELTLTITDNGNYGLSAAIEYSTDLYKAETIERMAAHYTQLLHSLTESPATSIGPARMLTLEEEDQLLHAFNNTNIDYDLDTTVTALFEQQAAKTPDHLALVSGDVQLSYRELNERANGLAYFLRDELGLAPGDVAGIALERNEGLIIAILAVLKCGAAYVPIDPAHATARRDMMTSESRCRFVIDTDLLQQYLAVRDTCATTNPLATAGPHDLAYIIFTSGSTGRPKGVRVGHRSLVNLCRWHQRRFAVTASDRATLYANVVFDASVWELFPYITCGAALHFVPQDIQLSIADLSDYYDQHRITISFLPTPIGEQFIKAGNRSLRCLLVGGDVLKQYNDTPYELVNNYGPTENTVVATSFTVTQALHNIPIGRGIDNVQLYIFNEAYALCPIGVKGELCIGGAGLALGYTGDESLTAEKFIEHPYKKGERLYRTGDRARWLIDGNIEFAGRIDDQVKIRGYRIEPGEIESALNAHPAITAAAVTVIGTDDDKKLAAYYTADVELSVEELRSFLSGRLPAYMLPAAYVHLEQFNYTASGKIDKRNLPQPTRLTDNNEHTPPRNETERKLAAIWQDVLRTERIGIYDNFFELGGHSLLATRIIWAVRRELGLSLGIRDLFLHPTIGELAHFLGTTQTGETLPLAPQERPAEVPASFAQERLWILDQVTGTVQYHLPAVLRLRGRLDTQRLQDALRQVVNRHEVLRTVIRSGNEGPVPQLLAEDSWNLTIIDRTDDMPALQAYIDEPFDLSSSHMLRALLVRVAADEHLLVIVLHHIAADGWSVPIIMNEIAALYDRPHEALPALPLQYADYAIWQRAGMSGAVLEKKLSYWTDRLAGLGHLDLPTDLPRPALLSHRGAAVTHTITPALRQSLEELSRAQGVSLYMTLLAAFQVLLYRYSGQTDICVGSPTADRVHEACKSLVGFFVNTVPLRSEIEGSAPFLHFLEGVKNTTLEAYEYQDVPFERIVQAVVKQRDLSRTPVFQALFALQRSEDTALREDFLTGLACTLEEQPPASTIYEITFTITQETEGLTVQAAYSTDLYREATMQRFVLHYEELLRAIIVNPATALDRLELLPPTEKEQLLKTFNDTALPVDTNIDLAGLVERQVAATPARTALTTAAGSLTYEGLNERANRLAHHLVQKGIGHGSLVPVYAERSAEMIVALLAILKSGAAYVPIDPQYPAARVEYMLNDVAAPLVLATSRTRATLTAICEVIEVDTYLQQADTPSANPQRVQDGDALAYLIYTSGSTGQPKGVKVLQRNATSFVQWADSVFHGAEQNVLAATSICFDLSIFEIFLPLSTGGRVTLVSSILDCGTLDFTLDITLINTVPSALRALLANSAVPASVRSINLAGEPLKMSLVKDCFASGFRGALRNLYGPTETTTYSTFTAINQKDTYCTIGRPVGNTQVYILNNELQPQPIGVPGEIYIAGAGVSDGYLNQPQLTEERFLPNPFDGSPKFYRTGDSGKWQPDGTIMLLGRADNQVKVKGFRIELGEIEHALGTHPDISEAVVLAGENVNGDKELDAYIVTKVAPSVFSLREHLAARLPAYMVPANFIRVDRLPLTPNGKIDRRSLQSRKGSMLSKSVEYLAPQTKMEQDVAEIWQRVLEVDQVGVKDNFFDLGGSSARAIQMVGLVNKSFKTTIPVLFAFQHPNVREFAAQLELERDRDQELSPALEEETDSVMDLMKKTINSLNYGDK